MLEQHDQNAIGKRLRTVYADMLDPMMPDRLNELVAKLLELDQGAAEVGRPYFRDWQRAQKKDRQLS